MEPKKPIYVPLIQVRRLLICLIVIIFGFWLIEASAYVDLKGANVLEKGECVQYGKPYVCVIVSKDDKVYVVLLDRKGEYEIYLVTEKESVLIWARDWI